MEILEYSFFQNALIGSLLASLTCAIVGTFVVCRRTVFISGGISHASFGGVGVGMFLGVNPTITAFLFAIASAVGTHLISKSKEVREDSAIAIFWILGMTIGIIFSFLSPNYSGELSTYLFGNILTISKGDIMLLGIIAIAVIIFTAIFLRAILLVAFDADFARSRNIPASAIEYAMMIFVALTIVATLRLVGVVLVISMLTVPQMSAMIFTSSYKRIIILSAIFGYGASIAGLFLSYFLNIPSGASVILCSIVIYLLCLTKKLFTKD